MGQFVIASNDQYTEMYKAYIDNNAKAISKLEGQVSAGGQGGFEEGDRIDWPDKPQYLKLKLRPDSNATTQGFIVKVTNKDGVERYQMFFPSSLGKSIRSLETDSDGKVIADKGFIRPLGDAAKFYQNQANLGVNETMKKVMEKGSIKISAVDDSIITYRFGTKETTGARLYTFDFVE